MNFRFVAHLIGLVIVAVGAGILVSAGVSAIYGDADMWSLLVSGGMALAAGIPLYFATALPGRTYIGYREGFLSVGLGWIVAMLFGALPYMVYGLFSPVDAFFESMSGFTTTGASVLTDYNQPHGILFWRSLTHWYGGMGIIVLFVAVLRPMGAGAMRLFRAEAPGPVPERLTPKIRDTAKSLWLIYVGLTALEAALLRAFGMDLFQAFCHAFGTMATGGFSPLVGSIGSYDNVAFELIVVVFMFIAGGNFALYFAVIRGRGYGLYKNPEFRVYVGIMVASVVAVATSLMLSKSHFDPGHALREALFQVVSIQTTTGYVTADFDRWNTFAKVLLVLLMFVGGSAGSTGGGFKVARIMVLVKNARHELTRQVHPQAVLPLKIGGARGPGICARRCVGVLQHIRDGLRRGDTLGGGHQRRSRHLRDLGGGYSEQHRSGTGSCRSHPELCVHGPLREDRADRAHGDRAPGALRDPSAAVAGILAALMLGGGLARGVTRASGRAIARGLIPDRVLSAMIDARIRRVLSRLDDLSPEALAERDGELRCRLAAAPIAVNTGEANEQHYELPPAFLQIMLGPRLKYSSCLWPAVVDDLDAAEEAMLELTTERAGLTDGQRVLELGCGWGSLSLWAAERFPGSYITAVTNSRLQAEFVRERARERRLSNLEAVHADARHLRPEGTFDRIVSVEMFEHMKNYSELFARIAGWIEPGGILFVHVFCHRRYAYEFDATDPGAWMARRFFTGGTMPSFALLPSMCRDLRLENAWIVNGTHYARTLQAWLDKLDSCRGEARSVLAEVHGDEGAEQALAEWRLFLMACRQTFSMRRGREYFVGHYAWRR